MDRLSSTQVSSNDSDGICSVCFTSKHLNRDGSIRKHGRRNNICPGSNKAPCTNDNITAQQSTTGLMAASSSSSSSAVPTRPLSDDAVLFRHPDLPVGTIRHIPKGARASVANLLTSLLDKISNDPSCTGNWSNLLFFGASILASQVRGGRRHAMSATIKNRTTTYMNNPRSGEISKEREHVGRKPVSSSLHWVRAVSTKLEDGNIKAALRILCSDDRPVTADADSLEELRVKHPAPRENIHFLPPNDVLLPLQVTVSDVVKAIKSFPAGSSGGPDGLRPQHIVDLINGMDIDSPFLISVTNFVNVLLSGKCPESIRPLLFGGTLMALRKKTGGLRPIAIGYYWRRLASKCANAFAISQLSERLAPLQLGVGISGGCEAAVHAARRFLSCLPVDSALVKLDFANAFNTLSRSAMLNVVSSTIPALFPYCNTAYSSASVLKYGHLTLLSQTGVQQGDPLGPLLFCLTIQPILENLSSELRLGFLDDLTLGGNVEVLSKDVDFITSEADKLGLALNVKKCEFVSGSNSSSTPGILENFLKVQIDDACLLGAPLSTGEALSNCLKARVDELALGISRVKNLPRHDALTLLRCSINSSRMLHILRCAPCMDSPLLREFDQLLHEGLVQILNVDISESTWIQATLPIRDGGLGIRRASSLALPAFLASAAGTGAIQDSILSNTAVSECGPLAEAKRRWSAESGIPNVDSELPGKQSAWDRPLVTKSFNDIFSSLDSDFHVARVKAVTAPHSGDWLFALPITACGLRLDDEAVRVAVGLRLGVDICAPHICSCGVPVSSDGSHGLSCRLGHGRIARHATLNDIIWRALTKAGIPSRKEPTGLVRSDGKRPDGQTLIPWQNGKCLTWDVTVIDTLAISYRAVAAETRGAPSELAANRKREKYTEALPNYSFIPLAFETLGPINEDGLSFIKSVGRLISNLSGDRREASFILQRISVVIQRYNSIAFRGTFQHPLSNEMLLPSSKLLIHHQTDLFDFPEPDHEILESASSRPINNQGSIEEAKGAIESIVHSEESTALLIQPKGRELQPAAVPLQSVSAKALSSSSQKDNQTQIYGAVSHERCARGPHQSYADIPVPVNFDIEASIEGFPSKKKPSELPITRSKRNLAKSDDAGPVPEYLAP